MVFVPATLVLRVRTRLQSSRKGPIQTWKGERPLAQFRGPDTMVGFIWREVEFRTHTHTHTHTHCKLLMVVLFFCNADTETCLEPQRERSGQFLKVK